MQGRGGKGNIYVWATGNGGLTDDDCNCDGYTTSIYTISIGCIGDHGLSAYYTELCSSTLAVTFNGGSHREKEENKMVKCNPVLLCSYCENLIAYMKMLGEKRLFTYIFKVTDVKFKGSSLAPVKPYLPRKG